jgi:adenylate cyclase
LTPWNPINVAPIKHLSFNPRLMKIPLVVILVMLNFSCFSQSRDTHNLDSSHRAIMQLPDDTLKVNKLLDIIEIQLNVDLSSALNNAILAQEIATKINYSKGLGNALRQEGRVYENQGNYSQALLKYEKAMQTFEAIDFKKGISLITSTIGNNYLFQGNFLYALKYQKQSLEIRKSLGDKLLIAKAYNNLAATHIHLGNYSKALDYLTSSLKISEGLSDKKEISMTIANMGAIYFYQAEYAKAIEYYERSQLYLSEPLDSDAITTSLLNLGEAYNALQDFPTAQKYYLQCLERYSAVADKYGLAYVYDFMGSNYKDQGDYSNAMSSYRKSLKIREEISSKDGAMATILNIGDLFLKYGNNSEAIIWCKRGLQIANEIESINLQKVACNCLYNGYKGLGDGNKALFYHEFMKVLDDSLNVKETNTKLQQIEFSKKLLEDSVAQTEKERKTQETHLDDIRKKSRIRNSAIGGGLLVSIFAAGLYSRLNYIRKSKGIIEKERDVSNNLLLNILPKEVADELKSSGESLARNFENVTVLFTDFKDFTNIAGKLNPQDLVAEINACFKEFDQIITKHGIEKIKTIGDSYMAVGGLGSNSSQSAKETIIAAIEMQEFMLARAENLSKQGMPFFEMRAGIHTGPVVAGIVGVKKFQYDIWGDTVNTASRMESSGEAGKVNVSQHTYELEMENPEFTFQSRGKVEAKGLGLIEMYFVKRRESL